MGNRPNCLRNAAGYSMLEVMIGGILLGLIALALLPAFFSLSRSLKVSAFQTSCNSIVRAKLQEYVNGMNIPGYTGGTASGFEYTKYRYLTYTGSGNSETTSGGTTYYHCQENPAATLGTATSWYYPGYRENINNNVVIAHGAGDNPANPDVPERLQGFQLYVNIRHYNPRYVGTTAADIQPRRQCPAGSTNTTPTDYQFYRLGDALEVVVTGMIRTNPAVANGGRGGKLWGPFKDINDDTPNPRLVCSATQIIYPPRLPFRYYLGNDGKVRNYQATAAFTAGAPDSSLEAMESHFRSIWSQAPGLSSGSPGSVSSGVISNIRSIAVSPENNTVYVLRPGELTLYKTCADTTVYVGTKTFVQTPDCTLGASNISTWSVDSNIDNITVDFQDPRATQTADDRVFALFNSGGNATGDVRWLDLSSGTAVAKDPSAVFTGMTNFKLPASADLRPRIRGIFLVPTFPAVNAPNLYFFDNTCATGTSSVTEETNCISIFNSADSTMKRPARELPVQVEAISY